MVYQNQQYWSFHKLLKLLSWPEMDVPLRHLSAAFKWVDKLVIVSENYHIYFSIFSTSTKIHKWEYSIRFIQLRIKCRSFCFTQIWQFTHLKNMTKVCWDEFVTWKISWIVLCVFFAFFPFLFLYFSICYHSDFLFLTFVASDTQRTIKFNWIDRINRIRTVFFQKM